MESTMQDVPLTVTEIFRRGAQLFPTSEVITSTGSATRRSTYAEVASRVRRLANALRDLGVKPGDRVATLSWNRQEHLEAYFTVPCMGAVLHTLNLRLAPQHIAEIINHAGDKVVIVDASLVPILAAVRDTLSTVEAVIVVGEADTTGLGETIAYEDLLARASDQFEWPLLDERSAAAMCYTTGTTGDPKGVVYSHRSTYLHTFAVWGSFHFTDADRVLFIVPMFHVLAWGTPYCAWLLGNDMLFPDRFLQPEPLCNFIQAEKPTYTGGVPTIFAGILAHVQATGVDISSLKRAIGGGSAVPASLITAYREKLGIELIQAWGMTETSPIGTIALPPRGIEPEDELRYRAKTGRAVPGVELRVVDEQGREVPHDGVAVGEIEVRGPWITASYYKTDAPDKFRDGWLRTGDVGNIDELGYVQITDRAKDVIKSGGEWISSVELENLLMGHPAVADAAVVGVPDEKWQERPLATVVLKPGAGVSPDELRAFLRERVVRWWLPERWAFVDEIPKTSVGKQDKKKIRADYAAGNVEVVQVASSAAPSDQPAADEPSVAGRTG